MNIELTLRGELADFITDMKLRGLASSKPEVVRKALTAYKMQMEEADLNNARLRRLKLD